MLPADQKNYLVVLQAIKILSKTWLPMILVPEVSRVNKLPAPCLLSLFSLQDFFLEGFFSKSSLSRTERADCGSDQNYSKTALPCQAG